MKSELPELTKTSCKLCAFAVYEDKTQTGCAANRINIFQEKDKVMEAYDDELEFYVVKDFCNYYRSNSTKEVTIESVKKEVSPTFTLLVNCTNITLEQSNNLNKLLDSITYYKDKIEIYFYYSHLQSKDCRSMALGLVAKYQPIFKTSVSVCLDESFWLQEQLLKKTYGTYFCVIDSESNFDKINMDVLNVLNEKINDKLEKVLVAQTGNLYIMSSYLYKVHSYVTNYSETPQESFQKIIEECQKNNMIIKI
jgi:hypothetical protein